MLVRCSKPNDPSDKPVCFSYQTYRKEEFIALTSNIQTRQMNGENANRIAGITVFAGPENTVTEFIPELEAEKKLLNELVPCGPSWMGRT